MFPKITIYYNVCIFGGTNVRTRTDWQNMDYLEYQCCHLFNL